MESLLKRKVLVLNKGWCPVKIITVRKAINLLFSEYKNGDPKAKIVSVNDFSTYTYEEWMNKKEIDLNNIIHSSNNIFEIPEIILLTRYDKIPNKSITFSKTAIFKRDEGQCMYCGIEIKNNKSIEHIIPSSRGGQTNWLNCVASCLKCNSKKSNRTPEEAGMKLLKQPYIPTYHLIQYEIRKSSCDSWKKFI